MTAKVRSTANFLAFSRTRPGFALALVLWAVAFLGAIGIAVNENVRLSQSTAGNRNGLIKARWIAEACGAFALAEIDSLLAKDVPYARNSMTWWRLDEMMRSSSTDEATRCMLSARPEPGGIDLNAADTNQLSRTFRIFGIDGERAASLARDIVQWRADFTGTELNRFSNPSELHRISNYDELPRDVRRQIQMAVTTEPTPYPLLNGNESAFRALPGVEPEAVSALIDLRKEGGGVPDDSLQRLLSIANLASRLHGAAQDSIVAHQRELLSLTSVGPEGWIIELRVPFAAERGNVATYNLSVTLRRSVARAVVVQQRSWP